VNAKVTYLLPEWEEELGCYGEIACQTVKAALEETTDAKLLIITCPTYEGILSDLEGICELAHEKGVPVLVDAAHGAHLGFDGFPKGAVECGADLVVHSLHKTLPCLTQTAMLHRNGSLVLGKALQTAINMFQTSSPSYLLLASIEGCIGLLEEQGEMLFRMWKEALAEFYRGGRLLQNIRLQNESGRDPGKLVLNTGRTDLTGPMLMELLRREYCIELEMAAERYGLAMTGMGDTKESLTCLLKALVAIDEKCHKGPEPKTVCPTLPPVHMSLGEATRCKTEELSLEEAVGRIAAEHLWAYPPGIPVVVAGEEITEATKDYLLEKQSQGVELHRKSGSCKGKVVLEVVIA